MDFFAVAVAFVYMLLILCLCSYYSSFYVAVFLVCIKPDRAFALYQDMEQHGPEPNLYTYNTITRAFAEAGRLEVIYCAALYMLCLLLVLLPFVCTCNPTYHSFILNFHIRKRF